MSMVIFHLLAAFPSVSVTFVLHCRRTCIFHALGVLNVPLAVILLWRTRERGFQFMDGFTCRNKRAVAALPNR